MIRMPAEWEHQTGVLLAFPDKHTDWRANLKDAENVFIEIIKNIINFEKVFLIVRDKQATLKKIKYSGLNQQNIHIFECEYNDTWARDFGTITVQKKNKPLLLNFGFNGWGLKFAADLDNQLNKKLSDIGAFGKTELKTMDLILEGGSIESDGKGNILTTEKCLLSPNRNPHLTKSQIEKKLFSYLGAKKILWLKNGALAGDDTDSHIDTLARICPNDTIAYIQCQDKNDEHYNELKVMESEIKTLRTADGKQFTLAPLPMAKPIYDKNNNRLPATYANYLIINNALLLPVYNDKKNDSKAINTLKKIFAGRQIIPINCLPLIEQHGSLHCVTMQLY